ncbi:dTDP-4-dehydrorhamnose 3,5-epimerase [Maricaulis sp.]|uniref:dTDP-4-dehydrorhamnose 3,5-epimerase n=1 Tax=Maricaulis sp. TaxID=1486257 RepID=UPI002B27ACD5|nr:dTDP-4-dehydrorhamnose 3,5-epimerase [Maricaulis sp.]
MSVSAFDITPLDLQGAARVQQPRFADGRGSFAVLANHDLFASLGMQTAFLQQNISVSREAGTVRGLHYQAPPAAQAKLVNVVAGRIFDVLVDARPHSSSFGRHCAVTLEAGTSAGVFVPRGFLHGFMTLEPDTTVLYTVDNPYAPALDFSIMWNDPDLGINWPVAPSKVTLSGKDSAAAPWTSVGDTFAADAASTGQETRS